VDILERLGRTAQTLLRNDWDCPIVVDGEEGAGKSMLALKLSMRIDPNFRFDARHLVFRYGSLIQSIYDLPKYSCIQHDEFGLTAFNRQSMSRANIDLVKAVMVCRDQNKALVLCVPSIWALDHYIKYHRAKFWLHVYSSPPAWNHPPVRGFVEIYRVKPRLWFEMPWYQLLGRYHFEPLPAPVYEKYKTLKTAAIREQLEEDDGFGGDIEGGGVPEATYRAVRDMVCSEAFDDGRINRDEWARTAGISKAQTYNIRPATRRVAPADASAVPSLTDSDGGQA